MSTSQMLCQLSDLYVDLSDLYVDMSDIMLDNFIVICMALTGQEHVFKIYFLTNDKWQVIIKLSLTSQHKDLTIQYYYLTSDGRNKPS